MHHVNMDTWRPLSLVIVAIVMVEEPFQKTVIIVEVKDTRITKTPVVVQSVVGVAIRKRKFLSVNVLIVKEQEILLKAFLLGLLEQDVQGAMVKEIYIKRKKRIAIIVKGDMSQR